MIGSSAPDPFVIRTYPPQGAPNGISYANSAGRTLQSTASFSAAVGIILGGQSNIASGGTTTYTATQAGAGYLNINDGGIYAYGEPMLGPSYAPNAGPSSITGRLGDRIITQGKATSLVIANCAMGGTPFASWVPGASDDLFSNLRTAILRMRARGIEPSKIVWGEGETDNGLATSAASITASINAIVDGIRALSCTAPFYIGKYTMVGGAVSATIQTGIANSITGSTGRFILTGYDADTNLTVAGGFRQADGTHLTDTGLTTAANGWQGIIFP